MRTFSALPILFLLVGCDSSDQRDMESCRSEALRISSLRDAPYADQIDDYEKSCMTAKGYHFSAVPYDCSRDDPYGNAACYARWN
jgi:hypothetical protein